MVRTRLAPSPTGYMHIGNLRTGLYAYCIARHAGGAFLLRIEDTDRKRNNPKAVQVIYDSMRYAGLTYDEGPDKGGDYGPYVQSVRAEQGLYRQYVEQLLELGGAYRCFCQKAEPVPGVAEEKKPKSKIDPCRLLSAEEIQARIAEGQPFVIRQRIPQEGSTTFHDLVFGDITVKNTTLDDQILLKSDGYPTYNFANVVDDHLMEITHVVRGVEYLSSTPKYNLLYQSYGWQIPHYIHLPHIIKESGKKLSKREGDASFQDLMKQGFLPSAIINYIALLGWNPGDGREFFTLAELAEAFEISRINKSKAAFSREKLEWLNGEHIRRLTPEEFHQTAQPFYPAALAKACDLKLISQVIQPRVVKLADLPAMTQFLLELPDFDLALFEHQKSKSTLDSSRRVLSETLPILTQITDWREETVRLALMDYVAQSSLKTGTVMWPIRIAMTGLQSTPGGATEMAAILGKAEALRRVQAALQRMQ